MPHIFITTRGLESRNGSQTYHQTIADLVRTPNPAWQYVEVGAGLGECVPSLCQSALTYRPIVIDPAPYMIMMELFHAARKYVSDDDRSLLEEITRRCGVILDPSKVELINEPLDQAVKEHPELLGSADVVIDNYGATQWGFVRGQYYETVLNAEMGLLKDNGLWLNGEGLMLQKKKKSLWRRAWEVISFAPIIPQYDVDYTMRY